MRLNFILILRDSDTETVSQTAVLQLSQLFSELSHCARIMYVDSETEQSALTEPKTTKLVSSVQTTQ